ncbi:hypothetical protein F2Q69_00011233 [Brassica cretica]|uniref:Uncharacterized protein n=1 Tax=Brassica cretica TaxID=69181 RepID=A0A8S9R5B0_BRACR|nr:hypothetical protein F2Q69_00011233 [Brassica cretica]
MDRKSWTGDHGQKIMDMKSWTRNHRHEIIDRKTESTQAQPEENSVAHDQDEMPSESEAETQVEAPSEENETEPEQIQPFRRNCEEHTTKNTKVKLVLENVPSTATDSVESAHPDREGDSRNVEQSTQAQPEENSVAHDQDEMPSESEAEIQVDAPSEKNET